MLIGLTCSYTDPENLTEKHRANLEYYRLAVEDASATLKVLFLPSSSDAIQELVHRHKKEIDGLLLSGGDDLPPAMYGAAPDPHLGELVPPLRPAFERELVSEMLAQGKPVLGICYGSQLLNVLEGGTLVQDIPSRFPDAIEHRDGARHEVQTQDGTRLCEWLGDVFEIASYHHQSIDQVAPGAVLAATAPDGIIEAVEFPRYRFCLGVQWHPERTPSAPSTRQLMYRFIEAAR